SGRRRRFGAAPGASGGAATGDVQRAGVRRDARAAAPFVAGPAVGRGDGDRPGGHAAAGALGGGAGRGLAWAGRGDPPGGWAAGGGRLGVACRVARRGGEVDAPPVLAPTGSPVADAVAVVAETAGAVRRLRPAAVRAVPVWQVVSALTNGGLLRPVPPSRI